MALHGLEMIVLVKDLVDVQTSLQNNDIQMHHKLTWSQTSGEKYDKAVFVAEETPGRDLINRGVPKYAACSKAMERFKEIEIITNNKEFFDKIDDLTQRQFVPQSDLIAVLKKYGNKYPEMKMVKVVIGKLGMAYLELDFEDPDAYVYLKLTCTVIS